MPLSLHTAARRQGRIRGAGDKTLRDASSRATKGVLSGIVVVRHDLLRRVRASSPPYTRDPGSVLSAAYRRTHLCKNAVLQNGAYVYFPHSKCLYTGDQ